MNTLISSLWRQVLAVFAVTAIGASAQNIPPKFPAKNYAFDVIDGSSIGTVVGIIAATDDDGPGALAYSILSGNDGGAFAINPASGQITVAGTIDISVLNSYALEVNAFDGADSVQTYVDVTVKLPPVTVVFASSVINQPQWVSQGYGTSGYLFPATNDDDPQAGKFKRGGAIYLPSETPGSGRSVRFDNLSQSNVLWSEQGVVPGNALTSALNVDLENPDGGTFKVGNFQTAALTTDTPMASFTLTFNRSEPSGCRIGILVGAKESQGLEGAVAGTTGNLRDIPYQIQVESVIVTTTQTALATTAAPEWMTISPTDTNTGSPRADWYFFDLSNIRAGASVKVSASRIYSNYSHRFNPINGVVISGLAPPPAPAVITGVSRSGNVFTINFTGVAGITNWRIMASADMVDFPIDETPTATIVENPAGVYRAQVDVTGDPPNYFMRIER